jgi:hypothetical protein
LRCLFPVGPDLRGKNTERRPNDRLLAHSRPPPGGDVAKPPGRQAGRKLEGFRDEYGVEDGRDFRCQQRDRKGLQKNSSIPRIEQKKIRNRFARPERCPFRRTAVFAQEKDLAPQASNDGGSSRIQNDQIS